MQTFCTRCSFAFPALPRGRLRQRKNDGIYASQVSGDQWDQYEARKSDELAKQRDLVQNVEARERHHQVFLNPSSRRAFLSAAHQFMSVAQDAKSRSPEAADTERRLWIVETTADDSFGLLHGAPHPPRVVLMESLPTSTASTDDKTGRQGDAQTWISALDRAGTALSPHPTYCVDYAVWGGASSVDGFHHLSRRGFVACEILNADWAQATSIEGMRDTLLSHAKAAVQSSKVVAYQVLQSIDEPTVFKTVEVYRCQDDLREHMRTLDPGFKKEMMKYRAAVNRVRQLYRQVESLNEKV